jgi:hypothetical protein
VCWLRHLLLLLLLLLGHGHSSARAPQRAHLDDDHLPAAQLHHHGL